MGEIAYVNQFRQPEVRSLDERIRAKAKIANTKAVCDGFAPAFELAFNTYCEPGLCDATGKALGVVEALEVIRKAIEAARLPRAENEALDAFIAKVEKIGGEE